MGTAPPDRRAINARVTGDVNEVTGWALTDAFCGFKAYRASALELMRLPSPGTPCRSSSGPRRTGRALRVSELPVARIYFDGDRSFGQDLDDPEARSGTICGCGSTLSEARTDGGRFDVCASARILTTSRSAWAAPWPSWSPRAAASPSSTSPTVSRRLTERTSGGWPRRPRPRACSACRARTLTRPTAICSTRVEARIALAEVLQRTAAVLFVPYPEDAHPDHLAASRSRRRRGSTRSSLRPT